MAKIKIDTSWSAKKKTERLNFRVSKNFIALIEGLKKDGGDKYKNCTVSELITKAVVKAAQVENLLLNGDDYYI